MCGFGSRMNEEGTLLIKEEETIITMQHTVYQQGPSNILQTLSDGECQNLHLPDGEIQTKMEVTCPFSVHL